MNFIKKTLLLGIFLFSSQFLLAENDYVTIVVIGNQPEEIIISENGENYEKIIKDPDKDDALYNYNELFDIIKSFEAKGYVIKTNQFERNYNYFLLVRENE